jgi:error-prone DNA polymerase
VRLGLASVTGVGAPLAERIVAAREAEGPFRDLRDLVRRTGATEAQVEALATAGAFESMGISAGGLWLAGDAAKDRTEFLEGTLVAVQPPLFGDQSSYDVLAADLWATGISTDDHPLTHYRSQLDARRAHLAGAAHARGGEARGGGGSRHAPAATGDGIGHHVPEHRRRARARQRGVFEGGVGQVPPGAARFAGAHRAGMLERSPEGVTNLLADAFEDLRVGVRHRSRDFDECSRHRSPGAASRPRHPGEGQARPTCCSVLASWSWRSSGERRLTELRGQGQAQVQVGAQAQLDLAVIEREVEHVAARVRLSSM